MQFKDIKPNGAVYILNVEEMALTQGVVTAVSFPRVDKDQKTGGPIMVVDVTIEAGGKKATYVIPESHSVTYAGSLVLSTDKIGLIGDVESQKASAERLLEQVDKAKAIIERAPELLAELNPALKEKQETEQRLNSIENGMKEMREMLSGFIKEFKA